MSPLVATPNRGYTDWQRTENYDTAVLYDGGAAARVGNWTTPVFDVSRFAYLGGLLAASAAPVLVTISWWADGAGSVGLAIRSFVIDGNITRAAQIRLPNLGPFVSVKFAPATGSTPWTDSSRINATNRVHPLEFIPAAPVVLDSGSLTVNAGSNVDVWPTDFYAGPMRLIANTTFASATVELLTEESVGAFAITDIALPPNNITTAYTFVAPPGSWKLNVANGSGANGSAVVRCVAPTTGAM